MLLALAFLLTPAKRRHRGELHEVHVYRGVDVWDCLFWHSMFAWLSLGKDTTSREWERLALPQARLYEEIMKGKIIMFTQRFPVDSPC